MSLTSIRDRYGVPAYRGYRLAFEGRRAMITSGRNHYLYLRFDGEHTPQGPFHPLWEIDYLDGIDYGRRYDEKVELFNRSLATKDISEAETGGEQ